MSDYMEPSSSCFRFRPCLAYLLYPYSVWEPMCLVGLRKKKPTLVLKLKG